MLEVSVSDPYAWTKVVDVIFVVFFYYGLLGDEQVVHPGHRTHWTCSGDGGCHFFTLSLTITAQGLLGYPGWEGTPSGAILGYKTLDSNDAGLLGRVIVEIGSISTGRTATNDVRAC